MKYRAVFLDMDGTTLNNHHELTPNTIAVLQELSARGILVCIATGRSIANLRKYVYAMNLPQPQVPLVCYNGGYGFVLTKPTSAATTADTDAVDTDAASEDIKHEAMEVVYGSPLAETDVRELLTMAEDLGCAVQYYNGLSGEVYAVPKTDEHRDLLDRYAKLVGKPQVLLSDFETAIQICPSAKLLLLANNVDPILETSYQRFGQERLTIIRGSPDPYFVEFLQVGIHKGEGVKLMCEHLQIPLAECVAFGDGDNDAEMLQNVGHGCAMKNAKLPAKEAANVVIQWTNEEEGVAKYLQHMIDTDMFAFTV